MDPDPCEKTTIFTIKNVAVIYRYSHHNRRL